MLNKTALLSFASLLTISSAALAGSAEVKVEVLDKTFDPAGGFLAYTEFELSGEPLAEGLGLDLDVLDPNLVNQPTAFDYAAGIESYEYSEEAMYAVNYQSKMGPHIVNGPLNKARGGSLESLGKRVIELADSVAFPVEEIPLNMYPITFPYMSAVPEFEKAIDTTVVSSDEIELLTAKGESKSVKIDIPAYFRDYASLAWKEEGMDKAFNPGAAAGIMLKDVMWAQDFLGGMHTIEGDEEVEANSAQMDQDGVHALGVSTADGFNGVILTEMINDRLVTLRDQFGYDGRELGVKLSAKYDPAQGPIWFPHKVTVTEKSENSVKAIDSLQVNDGVSTLRDTWLMLWPLSEVYAFSDQRPVNINQSPAFLAVFDGAPFAAAPAQNTDNDPANNVASDDVFSVASTLTNATFKNLDVLHFNRKAGTLVDRYDGKQGSSVTTYDAAYALQALTIYQRSQDALAVGYASADAGESLETERGKRALELVKAQADFILKNLIAENGLAVDSFELGKGAGSEQSLGTQFAVVHGLSSAFIATKEEGYKEAARKLYVTIEAKMYDKEIGTYAAVPGKPTEHTPYTAAAISAGLRSSMLILRNSEGESEPLLDLASLTERYESWFRTVINGRNVDEGMQLAEWLGDSGENVISGNEDIDTDADNVPQITHAGNAMVMAGKVKVSAAK
ncbi:hypothetical protein [Flexibacterium corallicola]|uniref:hypothetical protein n=1 Tax=Flexibacterium corallicola TaxID=3037259 RepID=UPI00286F87AC|nr:hypothetical protein [Pseudovibrio sp. M1P-2-3]